MQSSESRVLFVWMLKQDHFIFLSDDIFFGDFSAMEGSRVPKNCEFGTIVTPTCIGELGLVTKNLKKYI